MLQVIDAMGDNIDCQREHQYRKPAIHKTIGRLAGRATERLVLQPQNQPDDSILSVEIRAEE